MLDDSFDSEDETSFDSVLDEEELEFEFEPATVESFKNLLAGYGYGASYESWKGKWPMECADYIFNSFKIDAKTLPRERLKEELRIMGFWGKISVSSFGDVLLDGDKIKRTERKEEPKKIVLNMSCFRKDKTELFLLLHSNTLF